MYDVSVIVPIYYGKKYIEQLVQQVKACWKCAEGKIGIELLLVNDAPDDPLPQDYFSECVEIVVLNTEVNRGVQGARVKGIEKSRGKYILFLDQDDKIATEYLKSQLGKIGDYDAVVCKAIHERKPFYNLTRPFSSSICKDYMLREKNSIISPGQVLMKKEAVSEIWKKNILQNNGADDWMLWLCMMEEGKTFVLNDETLFEHVVEGSNTSLCVLEMYRSEQEVLDVIRKNHVFSEADTSALERTIQSLTEMRFQLLGKFQRISCVYDSWLSIRNHKVHISYYLKQRGYKTIAIYGVTSLGKQLFQELNIDKFEVSYFIDMNAPFFNEQFKICSPNDELKQVDAVIISLVENERQISDLLQTKLSADIWTIAELLGKMEEVLDA